MKGAFLLQEEGEIASKFLNSNNTIPLMYMEKRMYNWPLTQRDTRDLLIRLSTMIVIFETFEKLLYLKNNMESGTE